MYDIIGDIHGHADELVELLHALGYKEESNSFRHPDRKVIFCGDFIDRGPRIRDTISIARSMCEAGDAQAVMGNHELNALAFHTLNSASPGEFLRSHTTKNVHQHQATLSQLDDVDLAKALDWFRSLPITIDTGDARVVHACWDCSDLETLANAALKYGYMTPAYLWHATRADDPIFDAIERVMKGPEMKLPAGSFMTDKEGNRRRNTRIRWFESPDGHTCASYSIPPLADAVLAETPVPDVARPAPYDASHPPVFVGHYWLPDKLPRPLAANIACVDYSVAKDGQLAAYRHRGERVLRAENFVTVPSCH